MVRAGRMLVAVLGATAGKKACASHVGGGRLSAYPAALNAIALLFLKLLELSFAHLIQAAASFLRLERPLIRRDLMRRRVTDSANQCGCLRAALRARAARQNGGSALSAADSVAAAEAHLTTRVVFLANDALARRGGGRAHFSLRRKIREN